MELYLQWRTNRKSYTVYRTAPFSVTLNNPYTQFQGHAIPWRWIYQKRYDIQTQYYWNTNRDLHTTYATMSLLMTLSDLAKYSMTQSVTRSLRQLSFLLLFSRQACAKRSHAGIAFTQWSKNGFFARQGRHNCANFTFIGTEMWE